MIVSKDTSNPIFDAADLLREAGNLPLLILCRASPGAFTICTLPSMNETPAYLVNAIKRKGPLVIVLLLWHYDKGPIHTILSAFA